MVGSAGGSTAHEPLSAKKVTDLDQRHARLVRTATFLGSTILIVAALWSAGFPPGSWWQTTERWWSALHKPGTTDTTAAQVRAPEQIGGSVEPSTQTPALNSNSATVRRLHLVATAPGRNVQEGTAQLGTDLANPQTYAVGALLENGSTLKQIHADHVLPLGLQGGDLLVAIDRAPLTSVDALNAALKDVGEGRAMTATVIRAGSEISVPLGSAAVSGARLAVTSPDGAAAPRVNGLFRAFDRSSSEWV